MADEIITELWAIKDSIAREHGYDLDALVDHFQNAGKGKDREVVDLSAQKKAAGRDSRNDPKVSGGST